jgi:CHAD domain-containing protein
MGSPEDNDFMRRNIKRASELTAAPAPIRVAALRPHTKCMRRHERALRSCRMHLTGKSVHDLRIATRRLLAQLELLQSFVADRAFRKVRRGLKRQLRASAMLRDAQVQLVTMQALLPEHPELAPVYRHLERNEQCLRRFAKRNLKGGGKLLRRLKAVERGAESGLRARNAIPRYRATVRSVIGRASLRLAQFRRTPPRDSAGIHRFRIALKKLRYLVESLPAELSVAKPEAIRLIRTHLGMMGEIHDLGLLIVRLQGMTAKKKRGLDRFEPVRRSLRSQYSAQVAGWRRRTEELFSSLDAISRADPRRPQRAAPGKPSPANP